MARYGVKLALDHLRQQRSDQVRSFCIIVALLLSETQRITSSSETKTLGVEALLSQPAVERLDEGVMDQFARFGVRDRWCSAEAVLVVCSYYILSLPKP